MKRLVLVMVAAMAIQPASALAEPALRYVGESTAPARSDDGRTVLLLRPDGSLAAVDRGGDVHQQTIAPGCTPRQLRFPRIVVACPAPAVLNFMTGRLQVPPPPTAGEQFVVAGRYWLEGRHEGAWVLRHRYTGVQYRHKGDAHLDSPTVLVTPRSLASEPCGPFLAATRHRLRVDVCGRSFEVKRCPRGCSVIAHNLLKGAYVEGDRLGQVALWSRRVVRTWALPRWPRQGITLTLTSTAVYASILVDGAWRVFRGELLRDT